MNFYINNLQNYLEDWQKPFCFSQPYLDLVTSFVMLLRCDDSQIVELQKEMLDRKSMFDLFCLEKNRIRSHYSKSGMAKFQTETVRISNKKLSRYQGSPSLKKSLKSKKKRF